MGILLKNNKLLDDDKIQYDRSGNNPAGGDKLFTDWRSLANSIPFETYVTTAITLADINRYTMERIAKHNSALAIHFKDGMYSLNNFFQIVNSDCECGIITIRVNEGQTARSVNDKLNQLYNISGDLFEQEPGGPDKSKLIRFSFHYFMGDHDVNRLLYALLDVAYQLENN